MQAQRPVQIPTQQALRPVQIPTQVRQGYPTVGQLANQVRPGYPSAGQLRGDYYPSQVRLPSKGENFPSQTFRGSQPVQVPVTVRNEAFPNQQMRTNVTQERGKEEPRFTIGDGSPRESSVGTSQQQQQPQPITRSNNTENVGSTSKLYFGYFLLRLKTVTRIIPAVKFHFSPYIFSCPFISMA